LTHQELELWTQEIIVAVRKNQRVEDSKIELKASWPEPDKAAKRLAAHANAARGNAILWLIGVDERAQKVTGVDPIELANWSSSVKRYFDGDWPRLVLDASVRVDGDTVMALYFETHHGAPFVVEFTRGSYPEFVVPWREGTALRAARRVDLLRVLVPIRRLSALTEELNFNLAIANATGTIASMGTLFREDEFHQALKDGVLSSLPNELNHSIIDAYVSMKRANHLVMVTLAVPSQHRQPEQLDEAWRAVRDCRQLIEDCHARLTHV
jgi:hypothetical protein